MIYLYSVSVLKSYDGILFMEYHGDRQLIKDSDPRSQPKMVSAQILIVTIW